MFSKLLNFILFGNYYLAFCIVLLSAETSLKNHFFITDIFWYLFLFFSVVVYYTHAYIGDAAVVRSVNIRSLWYHQNRRLIRFTQISYTLFIFCIGMYLLESKRTRFAVFALSDWLLLLLFPFLALLYYGVIFPARFRFQLRNVAWLKPFIIGFVCTGIIVIYPLLFHALQSGQPFRLSIANLSYFFTNWLFTTAIALMFDIKDFAADHNYRLKTFVVAKGLRRTIFYILLPLAMASFVSFLLFALIKNFSVLQIIINTIPFFLLFIAAASLRRRKGILYYLVVIDGLLLAKAAFGMAAMLLFN